MKDPFKKDVKAEKVEAPVLLNKRILKSEELFQNEREVIIVHGEAHYRLQITKAGKLILNK